MKTVDFFGVKLSLWFEQVATDKRKFWDFDITFARVAELKTEIKVGQKNEKIEQGGSIGISEKLENKQLVHKENE